MFKAVKSERARGNGTAGFIGIFIGAEYQAKLRALCEKFGCSQPDTLKQMIDYCLAESDAKKEVKE